MGLSSRFINSLRRRDWGAAVLDVAVVAIGILMALAVDEWREEAEKRSREQLVLSILHRDVQDAESALRGGVMERQTWMASFADMRRLVFLLTSTRPATDDECNSLGPSHLERWSAPGLPAFEELIAAGNVSVIGSPAIRSAALQYLNAIATIENDRERFEYTALNLARAFPELVVTQLNETDDEEDLDGLVAFLTCDVSGMQKNDRFRAAMQANFAAQTMALQNHRLILVPRLDALRDSIDGYRASQQY